MDSNEKTRDKRGFLVTGPTHLHALQIPLGQLSGGSTRILGHHLLQNALDPVGVTETAFYVSQLVQRIRHFGVLGIQLGNLGKRLAGTLQVAFGQVHFTQPVLGVARVLTVRVFAQERGESLAGLVEILGLDQVEGCIVIQLFLGRISRFATRGRCLGGSPGSSSGTGSSTVSV